MHQNTIRRIEGQYDKRNGLGEWLAPAAHQENTMAGRRPCRHPCIVRSHYCKPERCEMNWSRVADPNPQAETALSPLCGLAVANGSVDQDPSDCQLPIEVRIAFWQIKNPPAVVRAGLCIACHQPFEQNCRPWLHVIVAPRRIGTNRLAACRSFDKRQPCSRH